MNDVSLWECPNCGSTEFAQITPNKHRCAYCGTVLASRETTPDMVQCPHCGFDNERGDRYCNNCGRAIARGLSIETPKTDPAILSIIVTVIGSFFISIGGPILGLILGYRALKDARTGGGGRGSERLARVAIIVGWVILAGSVLPLCMAVGISGTQVGWSICDELLQILESL